MARNYYPADNNPFIDFWSNLLETAKVLDHDHEIHYGEARNLWEKHCGNRDDQWTRAVLVTAQDRSTWHGEYRYLGSGWRQTRNTADQPICYASEAAALDGARYSRECRHA